MEVRWVKRAGQEGRGREGTCPASLPFKPPTAAHAWGATWRLGLWDFGQVPAPSGPWSHRFERAAWVNKIPQAPPKPSALSPVRNSHSLWNESLSRLMVLQGPEKRPFLFLLPESGVSSTRVIFFFKGQLNPGHFFYFYWGRGSGHNRTCISLLLALWEALTLGQSSGSQPLGKEGVETSSPKKREKVMEGSRPSVTFLWSSECRLNRTEPRELV